jgi:hypothetical protein
MEVSGDGPPYGSPVLLAVENTKQLVSPTDKSIVGISLAEAMLLWQVAFGGGAYQNHSNTPIVDGQTVIYSGPQGGAGTIALKVAKKGDSYAASEVWKKKDAATPYITPVLKDGLLFGVSSGRKFYWSRITSLRYFSPSIFREPKRHLPHFIELSSLAPALGESQYGQGKVRGIPDC